MRFNFLAGSNPLQPPNVDISRSINCFPEITQPTGKANPSLLSVPGRHVATVIAATTTGTLFTDGSASPGVYITNIGRVFGVSGTVFYEVVSIGGMIASTTWGTVAASTAPGQQTTICSNGDSGHQLFIVSGGFGYIFNLQTNAFTTISGVTTGFPAGSAGCGVFLDDYFIVLDYTNSTFQLSGLADGLTWDPLDVAQRSDASDRLTSLYVYRNELWLFGSLTTEVWYDSGAAGFPFQRVQGSLMQIGTVWPWSIQVLDNAISFVGQEHSQGPSIVYRANSYSPARISTHAVENAIAATDTSVDVIGAWTYAEKGHEFYVVRLPTGTSWAYDEASQLWHERGIHTVGGAVDAFDPDPVWCHVYGLGMHLVGDRATGTIWQMSSAFLSNQVAA